jgi:hypothetical protein
VKDSTQYLNDYRQISQFSNTQYVDLHHKHVSWLHEACRAAAAAGEDILVFTHHAPLHRDICPRDDDAEFFEVTLAIGGADLTPAVSGLPNCKGVVLRSHTHWNSNAVVNGVRFVSNQVCYPNDPYAR